MRGFATKAVIVPVILTTLIAVADVVIFLSMTRPSQTTLERIDREWQAQRDRVVRYRNYQQAYGDVVALTSRATPRDELPAVITTVSSLARKRGLSIPSVNYDAQRTELEQFEKVSVTFSVAGQYRSVRLFIHDLEQASPFLAIEGLALSRGKGSSNSRIEVQIKVGAYLRTV